MFGKGGVADDNEVDQTRVQAAEAMERTRACVMRDPGNTRPHIPADAPIVLWVPGFNSRHS